MAQAGRQTEACDVERGRGSKPMPTTKLLRTGSCLIGIVAGLIELAIGLGLAFDGGHGTFKILLVVLMPLVILWGAYLVIKFREADMGAGVMLLGFSLQHSLIEIKSVAQIPLALIILAAALAFWETSLE